MSWSEAYTLEWREVREAFGSHLNPGLLRILERLGYDAIRVVSARDMYYRTASGEEILDCWGGFGSVNLGHNHPRLAEVRRCFDERQLPEICQAFLPAQAAVLARNLAAIMPGDLKVSYLCCTGSEAVEAALKLAVKYKNNSLGRIIHAENGMHGKTHGALSVTGNHRLRRPFKQLDNCLSIPFADSYALRMVLERARGKGPGQEIVAVIIEPIQCGGGVVVPPEGYLREVRHLCDEFGAVLIVDEVQTGFGRTGKMFAFEHEGIVPDLVTVSKAFGGGKAPIAACVARREVFEKAYGSTGDCTLHNATFNEMGGPAALATETIHILYDEGLVDNAATVGAYLQQRLDELPAAFPEIVVDVRGRGLLAGIELRNITELLPGALLGAYSERLRALGDGPLAVLVASALLLDHRILVAFTDFNRNVLRLEPPLTMKEAHVDQVIDALKETLSRGVSGLVKSALRRRVG